MNRPQHIRGWFSLEPCNPWWMTFPRHHKAQTLLMHVEVHNCTQMLKYIQ